MFNEQSIEAFAEAGAARLPQQEPIELSFEELGIEPMKLCTAAEVAHFLGCHKVSVDQVPEA